ncbi:6682_t:CDS:1, partial [Scutellospora calospora]
DSIGFQSLDKATGLAKHLTRIVIGPTLNPEQNSEQDSKCDSFMVLSIRPFFEDNDAQLIWDYLVMSDHLKKKGLKEDDWKDLTLEECEITDTKPHAYGIDNYSVDLSEKKGSELKEYLSKEPWAVHPAEKILDTYVKERLQFPRYVIYLDEERQKKLLIGNNTIQ